MNVLNNQSSNHGNQQKCCSEVVELDLGLDALDVACCESIESDAAKLSGLATRGARAFTGSNLTLIAKPVALELGLVNGSAVVAAGCCGGPGADLFSASNQGERVANIDVIDQLPAKGVAHQGVGHGHAFVENNDLGANENQVGADADGHSPDGAADGVLQIVGKPKGDAQASSHHINDCCKNIAADRPENLNIIHETIIAGKAAGDSAGRK